MLISALLFREPAAAADRVGTARLTTHEGVATVSLVTVGPLRLGSVVLPRLDVALVGTAGRPEDGLLPTGLFDAVYFDNRAGAVVINPRRLEAHERTRSREQATSTPAWAHESTACPRCRRCSDRLRARSGSIVTR